MNVHQTKFVTVDFVEDKALLEYTWLAESFYMTTEQYKEELLSYYDLLVKYHPTKVIFDTVEMKFTISPELQDWTNEHVTNPSIALGLRKIGIIVGEDIFTTVSIEQTVEDSNVQMMSQFFNSMDSARKWID